MNFPALGPLQAVITYKLLFFAVISRCEILVKAALHYITFIDGQIDINKADMGWQFSVGEISQYP